MRRRFWRCFPPNSETESCMRTAFAVSSSSPSWLTPPRMTRRLSENRSCCRALLIAFWQEPDGIVILDFKTDYIHGDLQQKAARYAPQLRAYAQALSRIYQCPVKKTVLYFFSAGREVEIDPE